jgi:hypothetical protein
LDTDCRAVIRRLEELIAALDRRLPRLEHAGEAAIARDAAELRAKAIDRIAELADHRPVRRSKKGGDLTIEPGGSHIGARTRRGAIDVA